MTPPSIVVLTNTRDYAADDVVRRLTHEGIAVLRLNADEAVSGAIPDWTVNAEVFDSVRVVWWRQFELAPPPELNAASIDDLLLLRAQWRGWIAILDRTDIAWVNPLWPARRAENKVTQLRTAKSLGFEVPPTLVTNSRSSAKSFAAERPSVVKSLSSAYFEFSRRGFMYTVALEDALSVDSTAWEAQPVLVQQRVDGADVRVVTFGDTVFAAECSAPGLDWRTFGRSAVWQAAKIPEYLADRCRRYLLEMGLHYCAFDFMRDVHSGEYWFLEANQAGEFSFLQRTTELDIASAFVDFISDLSEDGGSK